MFVLDDLRLIRKKGTDLTEKDGPCYLKASEQIFQLIFYIKHQEQLQNFIRKSHRRLHRLMAGPQHRLD